MTPRELSDTARYHLAQARAAVERAKAQHPDRLPTPDPRPEHESNEES